ncbi:SHOCT domain-containing protein [Terrabacter sp. NPDC080008]|uniref:SHOCT domain-containing protein n=1 Tax=Terrabacter sp. NPDC080008 TaxID=3155176 RepID=UPI00344BDFC4
MSFWDIIWFIIVFFAFTAYLMALFWILTDLFRDKGLSGWFKAIWVVCLVVFPLVTALVYLIARGRGMSERSAAQYEQARQAQDEYIRSVATSNGSGSGAEQIAKAKELLDSGAITPDEFTALKQKALAA